VAPVEEALGGVDDQRSAGRDEVDLESEVLDDRQLHTEPDLLNGVAAERDRRPVEPVAGQQGRRERLPREDGPVDAAGPQQPLLDGVGQAGRRRTRLVDDPHAGLDHDGVRDRGERVEDDVDVVRQQDVVTAEEDDVVLGRPRQALAVVRGDAEVGLVPHDGDARVVHAGEPAGDLRVRVGVVDDEELPVVALLREHALDGLAHEVGIAPVRHEDVERHGGQGMRLDGDTASAELCSP